MRWPIHPRTLPTGIRGRGEFKKHNVSSEYRNSSRQYNRLHTTTFVKDIMRAKSIASKENKDVCMAHLKKVPEIEIIDSSVPWFVRIASPAAKLQDALPIGQTMPQLPPNPPDILQSLLCQLALDYGVLDLVLLDLRLLEPVPAVGPGTIMLLGSARSARHLHTTADKLCRWLRIEHGVRPQADGLSGRNEVKLQNRRNRRKGRLVSTENSRFDMPEKARWVCVDLGRKEGQAIVVHLLTMGTREELNLDGLWRRKIENWKSRVEKDEEEKKRLLKGMEVDHRVKRDSGQSAAERRTAVVNTADGKTPGFSGKTTMEAVTLPKAQQRRSYHSCACCWNARLASIPSINGLPSSLESNTADFPAKTVERELSRYLFFLSSHPNPTSLLGSGLNDTSSTPFLAKYYTTHLLSPSTALKLKLHLDFLCLANTYSPKNYSSKHLLDFLGNNVPKLALSHYTRVAVHLAGAQQTGKGTDRQSAVGSVIRILRANPKFTHLDYADLERLPEWKYVFFLASAPAELCSARIAALADPANLRVGLLKYSSALIQGHSSLPRSKRAGQLHFSVKEHHLDELTLFAITRQWKGLRNFWKRLHYYGVCRDLEMYRLLYAVIVMTQHQNAAIWVLRVCGPEAMLRENTINFRIEDREKVNWLVYLMELVVKVAEAGTKRGEWDDVRQFLKRLKDTSHLRCSAPGW